MESSGSAAIAQIIYFSHGGGPLPILGDPGHRAMVDFMKRLPSKLRKPGAIIVISAHWEEGAATLTGAARPPLLYDYYGFPEEAYGITYPAPGSPDLARRIGESLGRSGIPARIDAKRGFDHGLFIPLKMMYPEADVPCLQISLLAGLDPRAHIMLGAALRGVTAQDLLVVGSGFSFHNMREFDFSGANAPDPRNDRFQEWLIDTCAGPHAQGERAQRLVAWEEAPSARYCHPREEHLLPLHVCVGMADAPAALVFDDYIAGKRAVGFLWS